MTRNRTSSQASQRAAARTRAPYSGWSGGSSRRSSCSRACRTPSSGTHQGAGSRPGSSGVGGVGSTVSVWPMLLSVPGEAPLARRPMTWLRGVGACRARRQSGHRLADLRETTAGGAGPWCDDRRRTSRCVILPDPTSGRGGGPKREGSEPGGVGAPSRRPPTEPHRRAVASTQTIIMVPGPSKARPMPAPDAASRGRPRRMGPGRRARMSATGWNPRPAPAMIILRAPRHRRSQARHTARSSGKGVRAARPADPTAPAGTFQSGGPLRHHHQAPHHTQDHQDSPGRGPLRPPRPHPLPVDHGRSQFPRSQGWMSRLSRDQ